MKKTRLLIATLVCAVMVMGIGFAWWTDSVAIGGTAQTGTMDVNFAETVVIDVSEYVMAEVNAIEKNVTCNFGNLYPGAVAGFNGTIENDSSIPVKLVSATFSLSPENAELEDYLLASATKDGTYVPFSEFVSDFVTDFNTTLTGEGFSRNGELGVNETAPISVFLKIKEDAPNDTTEGKTIGFDLNLDWQQYNQ